MPPLAPRSRRMVSAGLRLDAAENASRAICPWRATLVVFHLPLAFTALAVGQRRPCATPATHDVVAAGLLDPPQGTASSRPRVFMPPWRRGRSPPASGSTPRKNASRAICPCRATLAVFHLPMAFTALAVGQRRPCATPATHDARGCGSFRPASGNGFVQAAGLHAAPGAAVAAHGLRRPPARRRGKTPRARSALGAQPSSFFICRWRSRRSQSASEDHAPRPRRMTHVAAGLLDPLQGTASPRPRIFNCHRG